MDDVEHVSHCLCRVVDVTLQVHKRRFLLKDAILVALGYSVDNFVHVSISFADVHVIADPDDIRHEGNHVRGLAHSLAVGNL